MSQFLRLLLGATLSLGVVCAQTVSSAAAGPVRFMTIDLTSLGLTTSTIHAIQPQCWTGTGFSGSDVTGILTVRPIRAITALTPTSITIDVATDGGLYSNVVCSVGVGGSGGGGGAGTAISVTYSATPVFACTSNTANNFSLTLTGNATSSSFSGCGTGAIGTLNIAQNGTGGFSFTPPPNYLGFGTVSGTPNAIYHQAWYYDGTNFNAVGPGYTTGVTGGAVVIPSTDGTHTATLTNAVTANVSVGLPASTPSSDTFCLSSLANCSSGSLTLVPPYLYDGTFYYVASTGYKATKPSFGSWTTLNGTLGTVGTPAAGDVTVAQGSTQTFQQVTGTASVESEFSLSGNANNTSPAFELFAYDSTNHNLYTCGLYAPAVGANGQFYAFVFNGSNYTYSGSGAPSYVGSEAQSMASGGTYHLKLSKAGSTLTCAYSLNGGATFFTLYSVTSIGTLAKVGYDVQNTNVDIYSMVTN